MLAKIINIYNNHKMLETIMEMKLKKVKLKGGGERPMTEHMILNSKFFIIIFFS